MNEKGTYHSLIKKEPYFHIGLWCIVLFYPYIKYMSREGGYPMSFAHELNSLVFKMTISYFLYLWFFPKENKLKFWPWAVLAFVINASIYEFFDHLFHPGDTHFWLHFVANTLTYLGFALIFFTIYTVKNTYKKQIEIDKLTREKQAAEMSALKASVNPHFLFNTLNTVYANALRKDDKTPELILKLSDNFRYVMHDGQKDEVMIQQELQHLRDYIDLQKERLSSKVIIEYSETIDNEEQYIAPLLLIGFVENAFKYTSLLKGKDHLISIKIALENRLLTFGCHNPKHLNGYENMNKDWKDSGIGIKNTKQRLVHLYPDRHNLTIAELTDTYQINLEIAL